MSVKANTNRADLPGPGTSPLKPVNEPEAIEEAKRRRKSDDKPVHTGMNHYHYGLLAVCDGARQSCTHPTSSRILALWLSGFPCLMLAAFNQMHVVGIPESLLFHC